jgi:hypothetical protein
MEISAKLRRFEGIQFLQTYSTDYKADCSKNPRIKNLNKESTYKKVQNNCSAQRNGTKVTHLYDIKSKTLKVKTAKKEVGTHNHHHWSPIHINATPISRMQLPTKN